MAVAKAPDPGPTICVCLNVGLNSIREAIKFGRALTVTALAEGLGACASCGSCRPALSQFLSPFKMLEAEQ